MGGVGQLVVGLCVVFTFGGHAAETAAPKQGSVDLARTWYYRPVRDVATQIIARYPPERYHYVGVGRGPTPFMAMLQALLGEEAVTNLPLSYLRNLQPAKSFVPEDPERPEAQKRLKLESARKHTYTARTLERFHAHLDHFLPPRSTPAGQKTLLFIDFADTGTSIVNLKREVETHNAQIGPERARSYAYLGLIHQKNGVRDRLIRHQIENIELTGRALHAADAHLFKHLAEYSFWSVSSSESHVPEPNTREVKRRQIRQEMLPQRYRQQRHDRDLRDLRRRAIARYRAVEDYADLRRAFAGRLHLDPHFADGAPVERPEWIERTAHRCQTYLDRGFDAIYHLRRRR